jgi:hypothetical protein
MKRQSYLGIMSICALFVHGFASASSIVLWDGAANSYVTGHGQSVSNAANLRGLINTGAGGIYAVYPDMNPSTEPAEHFSLTTAFKWDPLQSQPALYGGFIWVDTNYTPTEAGGDYLLNPVQVRNDLTVSAVVYDALRFWSGVSDAATGIIAREAYGVALLNVSGLQPGDRVGGIELQIRAGSAAPANTFRYAVTMGGTLYVSQTSFSAPFVPGLASFQLGDLADTLWTVWDPSADVFDLQFSIAAHDFQAVSLSNVSQVGLVYEIYPTAFNFNSPIDIHRLSITPVPEPATAAVLAAVLGFGIIIMRRRRRGCGNK